MRRSSFIWLVLIMLCMSPALFARSRAEKQLSANLAQWEQFRWQGMAQIIHDPLTLRKNYTLAKTNEAVRLDIMDSGVLGLNAQPLAVIYIKDRIVVEAPIIRQLQGIDLNWFVTPDKFKPFFTMSDTLLSHSAAIIANHKLTLNDISYSFDKKYRLTGISVPKLTASAVITYDRKSRPDKISFNYRGREAAILTIDERDTRNITIVPLETTPTGGLDDIDLENLPDLELPDEPE